MTTPTDVIVLNVNYERGGLKTYIIQVSDVPDLDVLEEEVKKQVWVRLCENHPDLIDDLIAKATKHQDGDGVLRLRKNQRIVAVYNTSVNT